MAIKGEIADINGLQAALDEKLTSVDVVVLQEHLLRIDNPHSVTKAQVGLPDVNNTADEDKPVSVPQAEALALKANAADIPNYVDIPLNIVTAGNFAPQSATYQPFGSGISNSTDAGGHGTNIAHASGIEGRVIGLIIDTHSNTLNTFTTPHEFRLWINGVTTDIVCQITTTALHFEDILHALDVVKTDKVQIRWVGADGGGSIVTPSITLILRKALVRVN